MYSVVSARVDNIVEIDEWYRRVNKPKVTIETNRFISCKKKLHKGFETF